MCELSYSAVPRVLRAVVVTGGVVMGALTIAGRAAPDVRSRDAEPDYARVFNQGTVGRLDLKITASDYQALVDDMNSMTQPGPGGGIGTGPAPVDPAAVAACTGLTEGSNCTFGIPPTTGRCSRTDPASPLACLPFGTGNPPGGGGGAPGGGAPGGGANGNDDVELFPRTPIYVPVDVRFNGEEFSHTGFRLKGNSSLRTSWSSGTQKLPFRLNFDAFEDRYPSTRDQTFFGFTDLAFSNGALDASYLHQKVVLDLFNDAGFAAPRVAFMRVFLDRGAGATYLGLYTVTEVPSGPFLRRGFGSDDGNLYKPNGTGGRWTRFVADDFPKKTNEADEDWTDIEDAITALNGSRADASRWRQRLEARFDVPTFLRWLALNTIVDNTDAYGGLSAHNYYLYGSPRHRDRIFWVPWDYDLSMSTGGGIGDAGGGGAGQPGGGGPPGGGGVPGGGAGGGQTVDIFHSTSRGDQWPLIRFLLDDTVYRAMYRQSFQELLDTVFEPNRLTATIRSEHARIAPFVIGAEGERVGSTFVSNPAQFDAAVNGATGLVAYVQARAATLRAALAGAR